jgi:predicted nucleic acid-binding protein
MGARVLDASVLAALAFGEAKAEEALRLIDGKELFAPELLKFEITHVAVKKVRGAGQNDSRLILEALSLALNLEIRWVDVDCDTVARLAIETGLTAYDSSYLYVSRLLGIPLVTFDDRLRSFCN